MNIFVSMCCMTFDFTDPGKNMVEKEMKRKNFVELVDFVSSCSPQSLMNLLF